MRHLSSRLFFKLSGGLLAIAFQLTSCSDPKLTSWSLIPTATVAILENTSIQDLQSQPLVATDFARLRVPDSAAYLCTVAWVRLERGRTEELFILQQAGSLLERIKNEFASQIKPRKLNGYDFWELGTKDNSLSVLLVNDFLALSTSPLVIEAVIRTLTQKPSPHPLAQLKQLPNLKQDKGNLYVDWTSIEMAWTLAQQSILDVQSDKTTLMLDGFTLSDTASFSWQLLKSMEAQTPAALTLQDVVPQGTQSFLHLGVSDAAGWNATRLQLLQAKKPIVFDSLQMQLKQTGFSIDRFFAAVDQEIGFIQTDRGTIVACKIKEITKVEQELRKIRTAANDAESNLHFSEHGKLIHYLFWPFATNFNELHYATEGEILFLANSQSALQFTLERLVLDQTWGKTLAWQKFHASMLTEANVSYFLAQSTSKITTSFLSSSVERGYAQFSNVDRQFYTSMVLQFLPRSTEKFTSAPVTVSSQVEFNRSIQTKPYPVINHNTKEEEIAFVDGSGQLTLVSQNKNVWDIQVGSLASGIFQVDFFKNRKLQYALVAGQKLHIIDRLGRQVNGFPVALPAGVVRSMAVVDYDQTRNYRYLVNYANGNVYLLDAKGKSLPEWNPRAFGEEIATIRFQRMKGRDYFVALGRRSVFVVNRRAEPIAGFPVTSAEDYASDFAADTRSGSLIVLTQSGKLQWLQLDGQVSQEKILPKNSVEAKFYLLRNQDQALALRVDRGKLALFTLEGDMLFEVENPGSNQMKPQLAMLQQKPFLIIYDQEQQLAHVFSPTGVSSLSQPLEASTEPGFSVSAESMLQLYSVNRSQLATTVIR